MKHVLEQYIDLVKEKEEVSNRIMRLKEKLNRINTEGNVKDAVRGGSGGLQTFHINGFPMAEYEETNYLLNKNIRILKEREQQIAEKLVSVDEYLNTLDDSRMRRMIIKRYIEGKRWVQVAHEMGKQYTEDACRVQMKRFFENL